MLLRIMLDLITEASGSISADIALLLSDASVPSYGAPYGAPSPFGGAAASCGGAVLAGPGGGGLQTAEGRRGGGEVEGGLGIGAGLAAAQLDQAQPHAGSNRATTSSPR